MTPAHPLSKFLPLDLEAFNLAAGLRAGAACALPVILAEIAGRPEFTWVGTIGFWGCLVDPGGAWSTRLSAQMSFSVLAILGCALAMLAGANPYASVALVLLWSFAGAYARCLGAVAGSLGLILSVEVLVTLGTPSPPGQFWQRLALTALGGLWTLAITLVIWRLHPHGPVREVLARLYRALSRYAGDLAAAIGRSSDDSSWSLLARKHRRSIREILDETRRILSLSRASKLGWSRRNDHLLVMQGDADQIFLGLIALAAHIETLGREATPQFAQMLGAFLHQLARHLDETAEDLGAPRARNTEAIKADLPRTSHPLEAESAILARRLADFADGAARLASGVRRVDARIADSEAAAGISLGSGFAALRENFDRHSLHFRHAARLSLTVAAAQAIVGALDLTRGYWLTITTMVVLQPFLAMAWQRSLERVAGSVLGGLLVIAIGAIARTPIALSAAIVPLSVLSLAARTVNYTLFVFLLTAQFVLIAELFLNAGPLGPQLAVLRAADSIGGGALALMASFLLWPAREARQLPALIATAIETQADWLAAGFGLEGRDTESERRRHARAINDAEVSLQRLLNEPGRAGHFAIEPAMTALAAMRRLGAVVVLRMLQPGDAAQEEERHAAAMWVCQILRKAAGGESLSRSSAEPSIGDDDLRRMIHQAEIIAGAAERLDLHQFAIEMPGRMTENGHEDREPHEEGQRTGDQTARHDQAP